jgi:hypothetical protein
VPLLPLHDPVGGDTLPQLYLGAAISFMHRPQAIGMLLAVVVL